MKKIKLSSLPKSYTDVNTSVVGLNNNAISLYKEKIQSKIVRTLSGTKLRVLTKFMIGVDKGSHIFFRVSIYNHTAAPNMIIISAWTHSETGNIITPAYRSLSTDSNNTVIVSSDENNRIYIEISATANALIFVEDLCFTQLGFDTQILP